jgi:hypothetical protein
MVFIYYTHTDPGFSYKRMRVFSSLYVRDISHYRDLRSVTRRKVKVSHFDSASVDSEGFVLSVHCGTCVHNNYIIIICHFCVLPRLIYTAYSLVLRASLHLKVLFRLKSKSDYLCSTFNKGKSLSGVSHA